MSMLDMLLTDCYNICILLTTSERLYLTSYDLEVNYYEWGTYSKRAKLITKQHAENVFNAIKESGEFNKFQNCIYYKIEKDEK